MSVTDEPEDALTPDLAVELAVHQGATKTVLRIKRHGWLKFKNKSHDKTLKITSENKPEPFLVDGHAESEFVVDENSHKFVQVAPSYGIGTSFAYKAQIEGSEAEDPIVIVDH